MPAVLQLPLQPTMAFCTNVTSIEPSRQPTGGADGGNGEAEGGGGEGGEGGGAGGGREGGGGEGGGGESEGEPLM